MQLRLPKPLHGWRAFAGEVGIIVIGVLIALGAQQVVGDESRDWGVLEVIEGDPSRLGAEDIAGIRVAIQHARFENRLIADIASDELDYSGRFGVGAPTANPSG